MQRAGRPLYAPLHVAFYMVHAVQEHLAIHTNGKVHAGKAE